MCCQTGRLSRADSSQCVVGMATSPWPWLEEKQSSLSGQETRWGRSVEQWFSKANESNIQKPETLFRLHERITDNRCERRSVNLSFSGDESHVLSVVFR